MSKKPDKQGSALSRRQWLRHPWWLAGALLLIALIVAALWPQPIAVETAAIDRGPLTASVLEEGQTRIRHRYVVAAPVAGFMQRIPLRAGAGVTAGETVVATIAPAQSNLLDPRARTAAEAALARAQAALQLSKEERERSEALRAQAEREFARLDRLRASGAVSEQQWEEAQSLQEVRERERSAAAFRVAVAEFEVEQAQAALLNSTGEGADAPLRIASPVSGFVLQVFEESARQVAAGQPLLEVGDPRDLEAEIELLSTDAVGVRPGAPVSIEHWGGAEPLHGSVVMVEPAGFTKISALGVEEQRVRVRVEFESIPAALALGDRYRVEARIVTWHSDDVVRIPTGALFRRGNDWMTFIVEGGRAQLRAIDVGHTDGRLAEVISGITVGEEVVVHPPESLADGLRVERG